jgi:hypothetical protein
VVAWVLRLKVDDYRCCTPDTNTQAVPILPYGSEIWILTQKDKKRLTSSKMKVFRGTAGYILFDHKRNAKFWES